MTFLDVAVESFKMFSDHPKFIWPKLFVAFLYSVLIIAGIDYAVGAIDVPSPSIFMDLLIMLVIVFGVNFIDIIAGAMYPFMVQDIRANRSINFQKALAKVFSKFSQIVVPIILVELCFVALVFIISLPLLFLINDEGLYTVTFSLAYAAILLIVVFLFYNLYPLVSYESLSLRDAFRRSAMLSLKNRGDVAKATILSFLLSLLSLAIAISAEIISQSENTYLFWASFAIIRVLTAYVYAYLYVLNPVFYLKIASTGKE